MTQEEKKLLLIDLCGRQPYRPIIHVEDYTDDGKLLDMYDWNLLEVVYFQDKLKLSIEPNWDNYRTVKLGYGNYIIKPYLRPMSSMTEEEQNECMNLIDIISSPSSESDKITKIIDCLDENIQLMDWLNSHHFDYRGLIEKGLALEAPKDMYNTKKLNN